MSCITPRMGHVQSRLTPQSMCETRLQRLIDFWRIRSHAEGATCGLELLDGLGPSLSVAKSARARSSSNTPPYTPSFSSLCFPRTASGQHAVSSRVWWYNWNLLVPVYLGGRERLRKGVIFLLAHFIRGCPIHSKTPPHSGC